MIAELMAGEPLGAAVVDVVSGFDLHHRDAPIHDVQRLAHKSGMASGVAQIELGRAEIEPFLLKAAVRALGDLVYFGYPQAHEDDAERTDGIPLFVEEMTKAMLEAGSEEEAQRTAATVPSTALPVPASLHASLMARLDRLGPAKEVAEFAIVLRRKPWRRSLSSAVGPA